MEKKTGRGGAKPYRKVANTEGEKTEEIGDL